MKKSNLNFIKRVITLSLILLFSIKVLCQSVNIFPNDSLEILAGNQSNGAGYQYTADISSFRSDLTCSYEWKVTNGIIQQSNSATFTGGNMISVIWNNSTSSGKLEVKLMNCNFPEYNGYLTTETYNIIPIKVSKPDTLRQYINHF